MKTLITSILFFAFVNASHAIEFIDVISDERFFDGALTIKAEMKSDLMVYTISNTKNDQGSSQLKIQGPWFIAPESPKKVWIYDGGKVLMLFEFTEKGMKFSDSTALPDLATRAPKEVIDRINNRR